LNSFHKIQRVWLYQKILEIIEINCVLTSGNITNTDLEGTTEEKTIMDLI
jgi:hypothetical protein